MGTPLQSGVAAFQAASRKSSDYSGRGVPYSEREVQALVAPIALYPDPLVAQVLAGSTYPDQILIANDFVQHSRVQGHSLMEAVATQRWDPGVKALTEFPTVLNNMARNLVWTSELGESYHNQQADVLTAIQALRAKAFAAGNLKNGSQLRVNQPTPDIIAIQPSNPQLLYIPSYNPALVYGTPIQTPNYSSPGTPSGNGINFENAAAIGALTAGGCCDWGSVAWDCNWYKGVVEYQNIAFSGNDAWHGGHYGGYNYYGNHTYRTSYDFAHPYTAFGRSGKPGTAIANVSTAKEGGGPEPLDIISGGWINSEEMRGWGQADSGAGPTAFSSWGPPTLAVSFGTVAWGERASSFRGWSSHANGSGGWGRGGRLSGSH